MAEVLLSSEKFIKQVTSISDNVAGKYILPSLREAQEVGLKGILGSSLLEHLKELASGQDINHEDNIAYKELLDRCQYYLAYRTVVEVCFKVSYKVGNFGAVRSTDEHLESVSQDEVAKMQYYYQSKADGLCHELQMWLLDNKNAFPELDDCTCHRIKSNLHSAASFGIWLGGPRGKKMPGGC